MNLKSAEVENYIHSEFAKIRAGKLKPLAPRRVKRTLEERAAPLIERAVRIVPEPLKADVWHHAVVELEPLPCRFEKASEILIRVAMRHTPGIDPPSVEIADEKIGRFVMYAKEEQPIAQPRLELTPSGGGFGNVLVIAGCLIGMLVSVAWAFSQ